MKYFKLRQGAQKIFPITKKDFEESTKKKAPYVARGTDGEIRCFAVCPACDNPIQLIGIYKKIQSSDAPYGKHYSKSIEMADYNESAYRFCPYASHTYQGKEKELKKELTDLEKKIYYAARDHFALALYIIQQDTGLYISEKFAKTLLRCYVGSEAHMYYMAAYHNIPWMFLYFLPATRCFGQMVRKGSLLYEMLSAQENVRMEQYKDTQYHVVKNNGKWLDTEFSFIHHQRKIVNEEIQEEIIMVLSTMDRDGIPKTMDERKIVINERRFPNLMAAKTGSTDRDDFWNDMAKTLMPDI